MSDDRLVVVITGMSGAGRSTAAKAFEDMGFFVVDNLPPALIDPVVAAGDEAGSPRTRVAVAVDSRTGAYSFDQLDEAMDRLHGRGIRTSIVFLDAEDAVLVRRFKETRRPHPMPADTLADSIRQERDAIDHVRSSADLLVDTSAMNVHELRDYLTAAFSSEVPPQPMRVTIVSFGFKFGTPPELDLLLDVRFLPNPHWVAELRPLTGRDPMVAGYVLDHPDAVEFVERTDGLLEFLLPRYAKEGRSLLAVGVGCTGGHHRSVAIAEELAHRLRARGIEVAVRHKDVER